MKLSFKSIISQDQTCRAQGPEVLRFVVIAHLEVGIPNEGGSARACLVDWASVVAARVPIFLLF